MTRVDSPVPGSIVQPPFFPIGAWFEGRPAWSGCPENPHDAAVYYHRAFADLARAGFNMVVVPNCPESLWDTLLSAAEQESIRVILEIPSWVDFVTRREPSAEQQVREEVRRVVGKIGGFDSLLFYQVRDEPEPWMIPNWQTVNRAIRQEDPRRGGFSCFCLPESLALAAQSTEFTRAVFDIYPFFEDTPRQSLGYFCGCLDQFKTASDRHSMWLVLQSFAKPGWWRYPTPEELSAMTWLALAAGVTGLFYFIYQSLPQHPEQLQGLVAPDGQATALYQSTANLVHQLAPLGATLASLSPDDSADPAVSDVRVACFADDQGQPVLFPNSIKGDVAIGRFRDPANHRVLIVASRRCDRAITVSLQLNRDRSWRDALTGQPVDQACLFTLAPGAGRILITWP